jgi:hypothetical protein
VFGPVVAVAVDGNGGKSVLDGWRECWRAEAE